MKKKVKLFSGFLAQINVQLFSITKEKNLNLRHFFLIFNLNKDCFNNDYFQNILNFIQIIYFFFQHGMTKTQKLCLFYKREKKEII